MDVQFTEVSGVRKVVLAGRLDSAGVELVELRFSAGIVPAGKHTIVDMNEVVFLGSLGVRMFVSTSRALERKGGKLVMYGAPPAVLEIIETMGFDDIVPVAPSEADALALLAV